MAEFAANNHISETNKISPFAANYGFNPRMTFRPFQHGRTIKEDQANTEARDMSGIFEDLKAEMKRAQMVSEEAANRHRRPAPAYKKGDRVWVSTKNWITKQPSSKLDWKRAGPYEISKVLSPQVMKLKLPANINVRPTFHVSLLTPCAGDPLPGQREVEEPPMEVDGEQEWEVEMIWDSRKKGKEVEYLVKWKGYEQPSWQPAEDLEHSVESVEEFHLRYPWKPRPRRS